MLKLVFWGSAAALAWTHAGYPAAAVLAARVRTRPVRKGGAQPRISVIVPAHDEEGVIERRVENLLGLDYPADRLEVIVASDGSTDRTNEIVERIADGDPRVRLVRAPRAGKVAAQNLAVGEATGEILAFSDANAVWAASALRKLVRNFADPEVAYVCGQLRLERPDGTNREGAYWRYELLVREAESRLGSVTAGNGSIYAVRRSEYVHLDPRVGHDLNFPYLMVQRGRRAVYDAEAVSFEKPTPSIESEFRRKLRMFEQSWLTVLRGDILRGLDPLYAVQIFSHRHLRYASGLVHILLLGSSVALAREGLVYRAALALQLGVLAAAAARPGLPRYYVLISAGTLIGLARCLRFGVSTTWDRVEGAR
jgi:cellulose synthase/poly-beta-1,6-N-acetylglucosamine synthase-like glycosyltransferase